MYVIILVMAEGNKEVDTDTMYRKSEDVIERTLDGEAVLLDMNTGLYYSMDPVGSRAWELLDGSSTLERIAETLCNEYDAEPERVLSDLKELFSDLLSEGLVKESG